MNQRIYRSRKEPIRDNLSRSAAWEDSDQGLIISWEIGRSLRVQKPNLAAQAKNGELPILVWKGGVAKKPLAKKQKYGPLFYLAQWQGLRDEDLDIVLSEEKKLTCSRTGVSVIYTNDVKKYGAA